jgi:HEAT repeat protein
LTPSDALDDSDARCRLFAAQGAWWANKNRSAVEVMLPLLEDADPQVRYMAAFRLEDMAAGKDVDLFEPLAKACTDMNPVVRDGAVRSMRFFGKRAIPILREAMRDKEPTVRQRATWAASMLRGEGAPLYPDLQALQSDRDAGVRRDASHALYRMDSKRFAKPATWVD